MQTESSANPSPIVMLKYQSTAQQRTQARMRGTTASRDKLLRARNRKTIGLVSLSFTMAWPWQIQRNLHGCSVVSRGVRFWPIGLAQVSWTPWRGVNEIGRSETFVANKSDGVYPVRCRLSQIVTQQSAFRCNMRASARSKRSAQAPLCGSHKKMVARRGPRLPAALRFRLVHATRRPEETRPFPE